VTGVLAPISIYTFSAWQIGIANKMRAGHKNIGFEHDFLLS
jgi:hypothetical protein